MYPAKGVKRIGLDWCKRALTIAILVCPVVASGSQANVEAIRVYESPEKTRGVFDVDQDFSYNTFPLSQPDRLVIDITSARLLTEVGNQKYLDALPAGPIREVRTGLRNDGKYLRVVLDLNSAVRSENFTLPPIADFGHRLVFDLFENNPFAVLAPLKVQPSLEKKRDVMIAIDAGHGGEDPGAVGPNKVYEKDVVLEIAKKLFALFERERGYKAILTREGDYYVPLRARGKLAHDSEADVFLSIHADAFKTPKVSGASVYALTEKGSETSVENKVLEDRENRADLLGGVGSLDKYEKEPHLVYTLIDLTADASLDASLKMGDLVLSRLKKVNKLHKKTVKQAGFAVLKEVDVPSLLIETGFISNSKEARKLATSSHQAKLANAIFLGVKDSIESNPPFDTYLAERKQSVRKGKENHIIKRGETLSEIAVQYRVSVKSLKDLNGLGNDTIRIDQVLKIPSG